jgi:hypothetical protein
LWQLTTAEEDEGKYGLIHPLPVFPTVTASRSHRGDRAGHGV